MKPKKKATKPPSTGKRAGSRPTKPGSKRRKPVAKPRTKKPARKPVPVAPTARAAARHASQGEAGRKYGALASLVGREISGHYPNPDPQGLADRDRFRDDAPGFLKHYFPATFPLPWSQDHLHAIAVIDDCLRGGGWYAEAMPRGAGKTAIALRMVLRGLLYRFKRFAVLIAATDGLAHKLLKAVKRELLTNDRLLASFRSVCYPIRCIENEPRKCNGQLFKKHRTAISWGEAEITLASMPDEDCDGYNCSGSTIVVGGLTGALRGPSHTLLGGEVIRPDIVVCDDPSTRESAQSPLQTAQRLEILLGDVMGFAGPEQEIACVVPCTIIATGDLADQITDQKVYPQFQGHRTKSVYEWPKNWGLWEEYLKLRAEGQRVPEKRTAATEFYASHREEMDLGSEVAWPERFPKSKLSAIQHMIDLRADLRTPAFDAEYQNEPYVAEDPGGVLLTTAAIVQKVNGLERGTVPADASVVTGFVDVHSQLLVWAVTAWTTDFTGGLIAYGTYPQQPTRTWSVRNPPVPLIDRAPPGTGEEGAIRHGLMMLTNEICGRNWVGVTGTIHKVSRVMIDSGYKDSIIFEVVRASPHSAILLPSQGFAVGAKNRPFSEYTQHPGTGETWSKYDWYKTRHARHQQFWLRFNTNFWKEFLFARLNLGIGDRSALTLFQAPPEDHRQLADQITAEKATLMEGNGRKVLEFDLLPGGRENHLLDCCVGTAVAASERGCVLPGETPPPTPKPKASWRAMQQAARERSGR